MKSCIKQVLVLSALVFAGHAAAQSVNIGPGGVRIGSDVPPAQTKGTEHAPGQLKKEYGGSATDYAPGQVKKDTGTTINFGSGDDKPNAKGKSGQKGPAKTKDGAAKSQGHGKNQ